MNSIFRRYSLTEANLSTYVKTSNEDKYNRGATHCFGKWIPEWRHPLVPDAMPYGIGKSGWSEQCSRRSTCRANIPTCDALGGQIPIRWHSRSEEQARERTQAHHQHQGGQGSGK